MDSFSQLLPAVYSESDTDGSFAAFVSALDGMQSDLIAAIQQLSGVSLARFTPYSFISYVGNDHGNPFPFLTPDRLKNKLDDLAIIYQKRGTRQGIISACYYLCGVKIVIVEDFEWGWILNNSQLNINTRLANGSAPAFWVKIAASVPAQVQEELAIVINFMKSARMQWRFVTIPGEIPMGSLESAVINNETLVVQGWAASILQGAPVAWVDIQVDGLSVGFADLDEQTARNDVQIIMAAAGSLKDCTKSQFGFSMSINDMVPGQHQISAVATQLDGQMATVGIQNINI